MTDLPETRAEPLSAVELEQALDRTSGDSRAAAALLLALPLGELPVVAAKLEQEQWRWRDAEVEWTGNAVRDVVSLIQAGRREGDRFVVPVGEPWQWVRPTRSGYKVIVWGTDTLLGAPAMSADPDVSLEEIWGVVRAWWEGTLTEVPAVFSEADSRVLITGDATAWHLVGANHTEQSARDERPIEMRALTLCATIARSLGATRATLAHLEDDQWGTHTVVRAEVDGYIVEIPVRFTSASTLIGVSPRALRIATAAAPMGFEVLGLDSGGQIICRAPDGTWVRLAS